MRTCTRETALGAVADAVPELAAIVLARSRVLLTGALIVIVGKVESKPKFVTGAGVSVLPLPAPDALSSPKTSSV
jgi:hypothetical protein